MTTPRPGVEPYRLLFPLGIAAAAAGSAVWPAAWAGVLPYPGPLHRDLMMPGFEQCFISGFLLTAMPAFTHGAKCTRTELAWAVALALATVAAGIAGSQPLIASAQLASLLLLVVSLARRVTQSRQLPPEEFLFVAFGLAAGILGTSLRLAAAFGAGPDLPARFAERLVSLGMVFTIVVGVGSLLVPTFAGMPRPLELAGLAGPHERRGRRGLYLALVGVLAAALVADVLRVAMLGHLLRAVAGSVVLVMGWKITRRPGHATLHAHALWISGWAILAGLWLAALVPAHELTGLHIVFIGGFLLLTLAIATRVAVSHGRHSLAIEPRVLSHAVVGLLAVALTLRVLAELNSGHRTAWLGASGSAALCMLVMWGVRVVRLMTRG